MMQPLANHVHCTEATSSATAVLSPRVDGDVPDAVEKPFERGLTDRVVSVSNSHWEQSFEKVYVEPSLVTPWYSVLGNHDYHREGRVEAQLQYESANNDLWKLRERYYRSKQLSDQRENKYGVEFFFLDTTLTGTDYRRNQHSKGPVAKRIILRNHMI